MRLNRLKVGLDVDGVVMNCVGFAAQLAHRDNPKEPIITEEEVTSWGPNGERTDVLINYYNTSEFYENQPLNDGAKEFVSKLSKIADVFFVTAVPPEFMGIRATRLKNEFPEVPSENIILGGRKDIMKLDMLLDDGAHNIDGSIAKYPVLFRRPWNAHKTGLLAIQSYDEFLEVVKTVNSVSVMDAADANPIVLIGPSGSGKTAIAEFLLKDERFAKPKSITTRAPRNAEDYKSYNFVTKEEFRKMYNDGDFLETTVYATHSYGTSKKDVEELMRCGKKVVLVMDICGAVSVKTRMPNTMTVFVKRDKESIVKSLLQRENVLIDETVNRIISIDKEMKNELLCDITVNNKGNLEEVVQGFKSIIS